MTTKTCFKCLFKKPLEAFYKHSRMADGRLNKCMDCAKSDVNKHRQENLLNIRAYDRMRGLMPHRVAARKEYAKTPAFAESHKSATLRWVAKHPERRKAHHTVSNALRDGKLQKLPCLVCGNDKVEGHHPDYSRPLDVVWLCNTHHRQTHTMAVSA